MQNDECRMTNAERHGRNVGHRRYAARIGMGVALHRRGAGFTLIELLVALGLTAILLTAVVEIFGKATQAFNNARASVEAHQNARAAFDAMMRDITGAEYCQYGASVNGYFAIQPDPCDYRATFLTGTATGGGANTLENTNAEWPAGSLVGAHVRLTGGTGEGHVGTITSNTTTQLAVGVAWVPSPDNTTTYRIDYCASGGSGNTLNKLNDPDTNWLPDGLVGAYVWTTGGTGEGQVRRITSNTATQLVVAPTWATTPDNTSLYRIGYPSLTFTTLGPQPGARYAAPEVIHQIALVRYSLQWDGGAVTITDEAGERIQRPTFRLVKRVRFPKTTDPSLDMEEFDWHNLPLEVDPSDADRRQYAQPEPIAFGILSMDIRVFYRGGTAFVDYGTVKDAGNGPDFLEDGGQDWTTDRHNGRTVRIITGEGAGQERTISSTHDGTKIDITASWDPAHIPDDTSQYRIEDDFDGPEWYGFDAGVNDYLILGLTDRPPTLVEVTLTITDQKGKRVHTFVERFYVPASVRDL